MLAFAFQDRLDRLKRSVVMFVPRVVRNLSLLLIIMGILAIGYASFASHNPFSGEANVDQNLILGLAATVGGLLTYRIWNVVAENLISRYSLGR